MLYLYIMGDKFWMKAKLFGSQIHKKKTKKKNKSLYMSVFILVSKRDIWRQSGKKGDMGRMRYWLIQRR